MSLRDLVQELADIGPSEFLFRAAWELKMRSGLMGRLAEEAPAGPVDSRWHERLPFESPDAAGAWLKSHLADDAKEELKRRAFASLQGNITAFGHLRLQYGNPVDWHRHPITGRRWPADVHWSQAFRSRGEGDIKFIWEIARFPHAYWLARAAAADPGLADPLAAGLIAQIRDFRSANPYGRGVHWSSGMEVAIRMMSWVFAASVFASRWDDAARRDAGAGILDAAIHIESYFDFARKSVTNDHLIGEATALLIAAVLFPAHERASSWRSTALGVLSREADRQIDRDGAYFMASHNYHRAVLQYYLWASRFAGPRWNGALERSLRFLLAHMNPSDGRLPNSGSNDGGLPALLSTCDYSDFRPALQAVSVATRRRRVFAEGPWDEEALWLEGRQALGVQQDEPRFASAAFHEAGSHVLRGHDPSTFVTFRCGPVRNRFPQIDMLHVDVWWGGRNLFVDGGAYLYNGPVEWHRYFHRTASHNTITIDGEDQMVHLRQFRVVHWTKARLRRFTDAADYAYAGGEHYGYRRLPGRCVHHRAVLLVKDRFFVVYDLITGAGRHRMRLHWQGADFPWEFDGSSLTLRPDSLHFSMQVRTLNGDNVPATVEAGTSAPIRGWHSRYYGEKIAAPSLVAEADTVLPFGFVTVMAPGTPDVRVEGREWTVAAAGATARFTVGEPDLQELAVTVSN